MSQIRVLGVAELPLGEKKVVHAGETEILLIHLETGLVAVQAKCPHAGAPLEKGAICNGRLVCPWHMGTFALPGGELVEPPPLAALKTYAVRIDEQAIYVDAEPLPPPPQPAQQAADQPVCLLVGVGAAGTMAAVTLRHGGFRGRIVAVDPIADEPVDRTQLSKKALSGEMPLEKVRIDALQELKVERVEAAVSALSARKGEAQLTNGQLVRFDMALVATGGTPKRLPIPGAELAYTLRHSEDLRRILAAAQGKQRVVILGTSFIGLEAASALTQRGMQVTVVGKELLPFEKQFGEEVARSLKAWHQSKGTSFRLGVETLVVGPTGIFVREGDHEEEISADLVLMGVGVAPELGFEHDLPLAEHGGGFRTDRSLRAAGQVWVAGDVANVDGTRIEHWRLAEQHGRVAALGMLGEEARFEGVPFFWTSHYGKRLGYLGHAEDWDEIVIDGDLAALEFVAFYGKKDRVRAALSCGRDSQTALLAELMRGELTVEAGRKAIA